MQEVEKEFLNQNKEMFMKANGKMIKEKDKDLKYTLMEISMKENGIKILNMVKEY